MNIPSRPFETRLGTTLLALTDEMACLCRDGVILYANEAARRILGAGPRELEGRRFIEFVPADSLAGLGDAFLDVLADETEPFPVRLTPLDGQRRDVELTVRRDDDDGATVVCGRDVTAKLAAAATLLASEKRFRRLVNNSFHLTAVCEGANVAFVNEAGRKLLGAGRSAPMEGRPLAEMLHPDYRVYLEAALDEMLDDPEAVPMKMVDGTGAVFDVQVAFTRIGGVEVPEYMVEARDITAHNRAVAALRDSIENLEARVAERTRELTREVAERHKAELQVRYRAQYDALTCLPNRALFFQHLPETLTKAGDDERRMALLFIDLDGFKEVNDTLGHDAGDELLREAARRLVAAGAGPDVFARLGGDEFTALLHAPGSPDGAAATAKAIIDCLVQPFTVKRGVQASVSASIGIAMFPDDAEDAATLVRHADAAMYVAKGAGKACWRFYTDEMREEARQTEAIGAGLRKAISQDELSVYFQPKVRLSDGAYTGVEALLRWHSSAIGRVDPGRFVPVLEENGMIGEITDWAIATIGVQMARWTAAGIHVPRVAINVSARQLRTPGFSKHLLDSLDRAALDPERIALEVSESAVLIDSLKAAGMLRVLSGTGIQVVIDDFGSGNASLGMLARLPVDGVKIDRGFVAGCDGDGEDRLLVRGVIGMAHNMGCTAIAEGVESGTQLAVLQALGCDEAQGFLFAPPLPAAALDPDLKNGALPLHLSTASNG